MARLHPDEVSALLGALSDPDPAVRAAALRALVNLPLDRDSWLTVAEQVNKFLDQGLHDEEVMRAAARIPSGHLRMRLVRMLDSPDEDLRHTAMIALAGVRDRHAVSPLLKFLRDTQVREGPLTRAKRRIYKSGPEDRPMGEPRREEAAHHLSLLNLIGFEKQARVLVRREPDPRVRFWVSLALAGAGKIGEFKAAIGDLHAHKFSLPQPFYDPPECSEEFFRRWRDFRGDLGVLMSFLETVKREDWRDTAGNIAECLLSALGPRGEGKRPSPSGGDRGRAAEVAEYLRKHPPHDRDLGSFQLLYEEFEQLRPLDSESATELVSTLFWNIGEGIPAGDVGNRVVQLIYYFDEPFRPDIPTLFPSYRHAFEAGLRELRYQIAWTVSRAGPEELVSRLVPHLQAADEAERLAAAQLTEEAARYLDCDFPPIFGGGSPLPEGLGAEPEWVRPPRTVNTGFCVAATPDERLEPATPLRTGSTYYFWMDIREPDEMSGEVIAHEIPDFVPSKTALTVLLFAYPENLLLTAGADRGELYIKADGKVIVQSQPLKQPPHSRYLDTRLFFPVRTPGQPGKYALRCNIYWKRILLQSRQVEAVVLAPEAAAEVRERYWWSVMDYTLTGEEVDPAYVAQLEPSPEEAHKLSLFLNKDAKGTHSFHFFGGDGKRVIENEVVSIGEGELSGMINPARNKLRWVSWRSEDEWQEGDDYGYETGKVNLLRLREDLVKLAKWGYEFYNQVSGRLTDHFSDELENLMLAPGYIQIAMKESPTYILPASMIYDYGLDTGAEDHELCSEFVRNLREEQPLEQSACFRGGCPSRGDLMVVCPSGFWGFRHCLGMPLSVHRAPEAPPTIDYEGRLQMVMGESTDLKLVFEHEEALEALKDGLLKVSPCRRREDVFDSMKESPHLVYFYCHGGLRDNAPFLRVGSKEDPGQIWPSNLMAHKIRWKEPPRPLVFLNGCHTTAVDPMKALQFIRPLVEQCWCAGVIGTEITVFEPLATVFAEEFFRRLLEGETIGKALRGARLRVLSTGNPLGLVYIPFVLGTVALKDVSPASGPGP